MLSTHFELFFELIALKRNESLRSKLLNACSRLKERRDIAFTHHFEVSMKKDIHPNYRPVVFKDESADFAFLTRSTVETKETIVWEDGKEYPLYKMEISSASHPFFTGQQRILDTEGRVERFRKKYGIKE